MNDFILFTQDNTAYLSNNAGTNKYTMPPTYIGILQPFIGAQFTMLGKWNAEHCYLSLGLDVSLILYNNPMIGGNIVARTYNTTCLTMQMLIELSQIYFTYNQCGPYLIGKILHVIDTISNNQHAEMTKMKTEHDALVAKLVAEIQRLNNLISGMN